MVTLPWFATRQQAKPNGECGSESMSAQPSPGLHIGIIEPMFYDSRIIPVQGEAAVCIHGKQSGGGSLSPHCPSEM